MTFENCETSNSNSTGNVLVFQKGNNILMNNFKCINNTVIKSNIIEEPFSIFE